MTISITVNSQSEQRLRALAAQRGQSIEEVAARTLQAKLMWMELDEILRPVREAFAASGMTEDEASEMFEREKHAMRAEKRAQAAS